MIIIEPYGIKLFTATSMVGYVWVTFLLDQRIRMSRPPLLYNYIPYYCDVLYTAQYNNATMPTMKRPRHSHQEKRKEKQALDDEEVERALTASLFGRGDGNTLPTAISAAAEEESLFKVDRVGEPSLPRKEIDEDDNNDLEKETWPFQTVTAAAWVDADDAAVAVPLQADRVRKLRTERSESVSCSGSVYQERLRQRFTSTTTSHVQWAQLTPPLTPTETNDVSSLLPHEEGPSIATSLLASPHQRSLRPGRLQMQRCPDVNRSDPSPATLQVVQFHPAPPHPDRPLLLTAGWDKTLRFFQCGEDQSQKVHGVHCMYCALLWCCTLLSLMLLLLLPHTYL
jgi:hypothetical protein